MVDILVKNATLPNGTNTDIAITGETISAVEAGITAEAGQTLDAAGNLVTPPFCDAHFHMDATLSYGVPRVNESGTLFEGIQLWGEAAPSLTQDIIIERAVRYCEWAASMGLLAIRTHVDVCDDRLLGVEALLAVREKMKGIMDIKLIAFPQQGFFYSDRIKPNLERSLDMGVDVVGGIPHHERTMELGRESVIALCDIADQRGLMVDMHCDETDDPMSRHIETLTNECFKRSMAGRVTGSHLTSMHSMDNYYVSKLLRLMAEAGVTAVANPLANIVLQGRHDTYPKRRGMMRIPEMLEAGIVCATAQDSVLDPWNPMGSADMLDIAYMTFAVGMMTSQAGMRACFDMVTKNPAEVMGLSDYGIAPGKTASLVVLDCADPIEAIRLRPNRLAVIAKGSVISTMPPRVATFRHGGETKSIDRRLHL